MSWGGAYYREGASESLDTIMRVESFDPIADASSRVLVLGSMPGVASLEAGQYYAHSRNLFWRLMGEVLGIDPAAAYERRVEGLLAARVALWDVLGSCARASSLDSDIESDSVVPNDFATFFRDHPRVRAVCFNGGKAEQVFHKRVAPNLAPGRELSYHLLPSTSPANARISYSTKLTAWRVVAELARRR